MIGGRRLAAFALQPDVAEFLDVVVHDEEFNFRIQQVRVTPESSLVGQKLDDLDIPRLHGCPGPGAPQVRHQVVPLSTPTETMPSHPTAC